VSTLARGEPTGRSLGSVVAEAEEELAQQAGQLVALPDREAPEQGVLASGRAAEWPYDDAVATLGEQFAEALALDQRVRAPRADALGRTPARLGALDDLRTGSYVVQEDA